MHTTIFTNREPEPYTNYMCFVGPVKDSACAKRFKEKYNEEPAEIIHWKHFVFVGPVPLDPFLQAVLDARKK